LYAGIGYFAFSYAKAKCVKVLGFELNAWSVEGLRRGAGMNKWTCRVVDTDDLPEDLDLGFEDILTVFEMSNATAADVVERNRSKLPPVRHVNLGLLPTSSGAYEVAVRCLEPNLGGWLHVHENFASRDIIEQAEEVRTQIQKLARDLRGNAWMAELEHVEKVKTYAPGVMHCVLDIHLGPK
jgi:tRNA wybutosine-synthesizing protein 2